MQIHPRHHHAVRPPAGSTTPPSQRVAPEEVFPTDKSASATSRSGANGAVKATDAAGHTLVFKHNDNHGFKLQALVPRDTARHADEAEVVASHIFHDELGLPGVTYREAYYKDAQGNRHDGIVSDFIQGASTLEKTPVDAIKNPDQVVAENVAKGWMGDWDITFNNSNSWVTPDGEGVAGDFGNAMTRGISTLGVPRANQEVMEQLSTPENVHPIVDRIRKLSDDEIRGMVEHTGSKWIHDWTPKLGDEFSSVLISNRDELRKNDPFDNYSVGFHPELKWPLKELLHPLIWRAPEVALMSHMLVHKVGEIWHDHVQ